MYKLKDNVMKAYSSESREIGVRATFNDTIVITGENIKSYTITDSVGGTDSLSLGNACSKRLEMSILVPPELTGIEAAKVQVEIGIDVDGTIEYTPLGLFYVDEVETSDDYKNVKITAYDLIYKIEKDSKKKYTCGCTSSAVTALDVIDDICKQAGVEFDRKLNWKYDAREYADTQWKDEFDLDNLENQSLSASWHPINFDKKIYSIAVTMTNNVELTTADLEKLSVKIVVTYDDKKVDTFNPMIFLVDYDDSGNQVASNVKFSTERIEANSHLWNEVSTVEIYIYGFGNVTGNLNRGFDLIYFENTSQLNIVNGKLYVDKNSLGNYSSREVLGYMAGVLGCNAVTDRKGNVTLKAFENSNFKIPLEQQFMNGVSKVVATPLSIDYITTGASSEENDNSNIIIVGEGAFGFNFENPFLSQAFSPNSQLAVQNIYDKYKGMTLISCTISYRGNPAVDCGDIVQIENPDGSYSNVFVLNQTLSVTGGFTENIDSAIKTDVSKDFVSVPSSKRLDFKLDDFAKAYTEIIKNLTGAEGGYVKLVTDKDDKVRAITITQSDIEVKWDETNKKVVTADNSYVAMWVWSYGGLGFTSNGGKSYNVAINMQGQIYAETIVGYLSRSVYLQAEHGTIAGWTIGEQELYKDFSDGNESYRAYIQGAVSSQVENAGETWVFSTQKLSGDDTATGQFVAKANGNVSAKNIDCETINCETIYNRGASDGSRALASNILLVGNSSWLSGYTLCHEGSARMGQVYVNGNLWAETSLHLTYPGLVTGALYILDSSGLVGSPTSSKRYKTNITSTLSDNLNPTKLYELPVVQFDYKDEFKDIDFIGSTQIGFIAEDVEKLYPIAVAKNKDGQVETWHDRIMIPAMLKLIQEQKKQIDALEKRVTDLENKQEVI